MEDAKSRQKLLKLSLELAALICHQYGRWPKHSYPSVSDQLHRDVRRRVLGRRRDLVEGKGVDNMRNCILGFLHVPHVEGIRENALIEDHRALECRLGGRHRALNLLTYLALQVINDLGQLRFRPIEQHHPLQLGVAHMSKRHMQMCQRRPHSTAHHCGRA